MKAFINQYKMTFQIMGAAVSAVVWLYATFATFKYVDAKYDPIERRLQIIDERTWEMSGRKDPKPLNQ